MSLAYISVVFTGFVLFLLVTFLILSYFVSKKRKTYNSDDGFDGETKFSPVSAPKVVSARQIVSEPGFSTVTPRPAVATSQTVEIASPSGTNTVHYQRRKRLEVINSTVSLNQFAREYYRTS